MGYPAGDMGRPAMNPAPRNPMPARPANLRVMIISAQARPRPSPYKPRPAVQYISCHPYSEFLSSEPFSGCFNERLRSTGLVPTQHLFRFYGMTLSARSDCFKQIMETINWKTI
ncbi:hypothetical protein YC2023_066896 [Brassica napus]